VRIAASQQQHTRAHTDRQVWEKKKKLKSGFTTWLSKCSMPS
jgi:hypothetical protein